MGRWVIGAAWPYTNAVPHLGTLIGSVLSADVVARFLRMKGEEVIFVSGSDEHGTPIEVEARKRGIDPKVLTDKMHELVAELFRRWNISFDNYTRTENPLHKEFVREIFTKIYRNGYIFTKEIEVLFCEKCGIYLPDRFVEGKCPFCGYEFAKGDQCENCGRLLDPVQLVDPHCVFCGSKPVIKKVRHWFIDLPKLEPEIRKYIENNDRLPENARNMSLSILREGLKPRCVTRDNKWGIPAPFPGAEDKTIYVWFDAVLGYISATIEYFKKLGKEEEWKKFWLDPDTKVVFFIGKDNIPFHTIILPALLIASGEKFVLPWTVASTEYLLFEGRKFSKSKRIGIWIDEALELLPADYWRFALLYMRPETRDMSFSWELLQEIINTQLNDVIGNFVHRVLTFVKKNFNGEVPRVEKLYSEDVRFQELIVKIVDEVDNLLMNMRIRDALLKIIELAREGNRFLNERAPWAKIKTSREEAASIMFVAIHAVKALAILLAPFIPTFANEIWRQLGYSDDITSRRWDEAKKPVTAGQKLGEVRPVFKKISSHELEELKRRLQEIRAEGKVPSARI